MRQCLQTSMASKRCAVEEHNGRCRVSKSDWSNRQVSTAYLIKKCSTISEISE